LTEKGEEKAPKEEEGRGKGNPITRIKTLCRSRGRQLGRTLEGPSFSAAGLILEGGCSGNLPKEGVEEPFSNFKVLPSLL